MYHLSTETTLGVAYVADCFQVPPWPGTVLPHRRLRPCVVRGWSTSAAVRRHQNPVRSTDSYCHRRQELCSGWPTCMEQSAAWTANVELYCLHLCGETKDIFIFGCQRVWELLKPRYINLHITLHYDAGNRFATARPGIAYNSADRDMATTRVVSATSSRPTYVAYVSWNNVSFCHQTISVVARENLDIGWPILLIPQLCQNWSNH